MAGARRADYDSDASGCDDARGTHHESDDDDDGAKAQPMSGVRVKPEHALDNGQVVPIKQEVHIKSEPDAFVSYTSQFAQHTQVLSNTDILAIDDSDDDAEKTIPRPAPRARPAPPSAPPAKKLRAESAPVPSATAPSAPAPAPPSAAPAGDDDDSDDELWCNLK